MDMDLYKALREGNNQLLSSMCNTGARSAFILNQQTHTKNNILHIASRLGHKTTESFIHYAIQEFPVLARQLNSKGETPLHIASRFGHLTIAKLLIGPNNINNNANNHEPLSLSVGVISGANQNGSNSRNLGEIEIEEGLEPVWRITNSDNDTALHEALRNGREEVAEYLLELEPELACSVNNFGESPLYLAVESHCESVMNKILELELEFSAAGPRGQNPLHAATRYICSERSIKLLLRKRPELMKQLDHQGKTALHYAIESFGLKMTSLLLEIDASAAFIPDSTGLTPLLIASTMGWLQCFQAILKQCPESIESCDPNGQNALHLLKVTSLVHGERFLKIPELRELINERDSGGNTPLHLALENRNHTKVRLLLETNLADVRAINRQGLSALDICEQDWKLSYKQRRMWYCLRSYRAPRGHQPNQSKVPCRGPPYSQIHPMTDFKQMANTLSVVAALLAAVTFAAAFTMPGGYDSNLGTNVGLAVLIKKSALKLFILSDTLAMCSSITVVFFLTWAMLGDPDLLRTLVLISQITLKYSLYTTLIAFVSGLYAVTATEAMWVAVLVCIMGAIIPFVVSQVVVIATATGIWRTWDI